MKNTIINYNGIKCNLEVNKYKDGNLALFLIDSKNHNFVATTTVNLEGQRLEDNQIIIKDYNENKGIYKQLLEANVISSCIRKVSIGLNSGYVVDLKFCRLCENNEDIDNLCRVCANKFLDN